MLQLEICFPGFHKCVAFNTENFFFTASKSKPSYHIHKFSSQGHYSDVAVVLGNHLNFFHLSTLKGYTFEKLHKEHAECLTPKDIQMCLVLTVLNIFL